MFKFLLTYLIFGLVFSLSGNAQVLIGNHHNSLIGERGSLQGGAFHARADDASAGWYNPAGLALSSFGSLSANASTYAMNKVSREEGDNSEGLNTIPTFFGMLGRAYRNLVWCFSVATPVGFSSVLNLQEQRDYTDFGFRSVSTRENDSSSYRITAPGLAIGSSFSKNFRMGLGIRYYMVDISADTNFEAYAVNSGSTDPINMQERYDFALRASLLRANFGLQYDIGSNWIFGLNYRSPTYQFSGETESSFVYSKTNASGATTRSVNVYNFSNDFEPNFKLGHEVAFGFGYVGNDISFEFDLIYNTGVSRRNLFPSSTVVSSNVWTDGGTATATDATIEEDLATMEFKNTLNYSLGISYKVSPKVLGQWGIFSDNSPVNDRDTGLFEKVDLLGTTLGFSLFKKLYSTSFGLFYIFGEETGALRRYDPIKDRTESQDFEVSILGINLSGSYFF